MLALIKEVLRLLLAGPTVVALVCRPVCEYAENALESLCTRDPEEDSVLSIEQPGIGSMLDYHCLRCKGRATVIYGIPNILSSSDTGPPGRVFPQTKIRVEFEASMQ